ncbi:uncharacterized protein marchf1 [Osmerus eperlanus]|uniref:uncharacterized protein marchf1 n=1 Tax=Osmerus eperlanus TaxID=29151 RepID=UPI002E11F3EB
MPVHQISVVPVQETASNGKSASRSKDKTEGGKASGRSGSRSSNISKASSSTTGLGTATVSRTSVTPSSQDICSTGPLTRLEEDVSDGHTQKPPQKGAMAATSAKQSSSQKKQVKRRQRPKRDSCTATVETIAQPPPDRERSPSSERSDRAEKQDKGSKPRKEHVRHRGSIPPQSESSEEDEETWRQSRSWSKEKARRGRRRSGSSRDRDGGRGGGGDGGEIMELQSVGSDEGRENKENQAPVENGQGGLKSRRGGAPRREGRASQRGGTQRLDGESRSPGSSSLVEEGEEHITKRYQERGAGGGDMSVPTTRSDCAVNGTVEPGSDDEMEVCRICHCEGDEEFSLITPCRCTGSMRFVHMACLNQWIKSSDTRCCELCKYDFIMETQLKPLGKWEKLQMSTSERRKIFCSVVFHLIAIICVLWSVQVLVKRTIDEISLGKSYDYFWSLNLQNYSTTEVFQWPFWTKLIVVGISSSGGLIFMYIQCKVYLQLWRRLKAFNRIITVQNCSERAQHPVQAPPPITTLANGKHDTVAVPMGQLSKGGQESQSDSDSTTEDAVAPAESPV